ncbi:MAG: flagellar basal body-associated FliL family protein [Pirellulaceae bacterium]|nr:flagellar basal body-associated FliL family protein [Pirellulaceae bacterium]
MKNDLWNRSDASYILGNLFLSALLLCLTGCSEEMAEGNESTEEVAKEIVEIELDRFDFRVFQLANNTNLQVRIHLYVGVYDTDSDLFRHLYETKHHQIRENALTIIRESTPGELESPNLEVLTDRLKTSINLAFPEPYVQEVYFSEYWVQVK